MSEVLFIKTVKATCFLCKEQKEKSCIMTSSKVTFCVCEECVQKVYLAAARYLILPDADRQGT